MSPPSPPDNLDGWLALLERRHPKAIDLGLDRCRAVWERMGRPLPAQRIVVVGGTNGKGSVVATLCSLLGALGFSHGSYTSPHLLRFTERVRIGGQESRDADWLSAFEEVESALEGTSLTYFEFTTLAAFRLLERQSLDFAVMEVGLGGRLDTVNLLDADCAVITSLGLDHEEFLGGDLESIGREKAGIMRPGKPVVCSEPEPPASVTGRAREIGAELMLRQRDFDVRSGPDGLRFQMDGIDLSLRPPALAGEHQAANAATALAALLRLVPEAAEQKECLDRGLAAVRVPGRLERVMDRPAVWVDVGHNPLAARAVAETLGKLLAGQGVNRFRCVLAMLDDKDAGAAVLALAPLVEQWYCGGLSGARGQSGKRLAERLAQAVPEASRRSYDTVADALEAALADSAPNDGILVFGSFFTASEALQRLAAMTATTRRRST